MNERLRPPPSVRRGEGDSEQLMPEMQHRSNLRVSDHYRAGGTRA